jgi:integrase
MTKLKTMHRLRPTDISGLLARNGLHNDGGSLYLQVRNGRGAWVYQRREGSRLRSYGLGSCPPVTLAEARKARADKARNEAVPRAPRVLFGKAATAYLKAYGSEWKDGGARAHTLLLNAAPLDNRPVNLITDDEVADVLRPIWTGPGGNKGSKLRGLIEQVLASAKVKDNPATWAKQKHCNLIRKGKQTNHRPSLPWREVPALMGELAAMSSVQARAIRFTILTAARQNETLPAQWGEIDLAAKTWTVPAARMKPSADGKKKPHTVPLSSQALACLGEAGTGFVFKIGRTAVRRLLQSFNRVDPTILDKDGKPKPIVLHGFRTSFTNWAAEAEVHYPSELREMALAHSVGDVVEQTYRTTTLVNKRREMMADWAAFLAAE